MLRLTIMLSLIRSPNSIVLPSITLRYASCYRRLCDCRLCKSDSRRAQALSVANHVAQRFQQVRGRRNQPRVCFSCCRPERLTRKCRAMRHVCYKRSASRHLTICVTNFDSVNYRESILPRSRRMRHNIYVNADASLRSRRLRQRSTRRATGSALCSPVYPGPFQSMVRGLGGQDCALESHPSGLLRWHQTRG